MHYVNITSFQDLLYVPSAASSGPINMSGSSSIFDPRAQCARNKHYKLWCHHMELGELSEPRHAMFERNWNLQ